MISFWGTWGTHLSRMSKVWSYLEADGGARRHWVFLFHTRMCVLIRRKQRRRMTYRTLWAMGDVMMSPTSPQAVTSLLSSWTHVYSAYPEAYPHPELWDILSPVRCPIILMSFLMYFSHLYPTIKDGKHSSGKILNDLILGGKKTNSRNRGKIQMSLSHSPKHGWTGKICKRFKMYTLFPRGALIYCGDKA